VTKEQLDDIRARLRVGFIPHKHDAEVLVAEVDALRRALVDAHRENERARKSEGHYRASTRRFAKERDAAFDLLRKFVSFLKHGADCDCLVCYDVAADVAAAETLTTKGDER
jgi:hypothetical protein